jgi:(p)ppGpp synthase/HD superfamily hydrolase
MTGMTAKRGRVHNKERRTQPRFFFTDRILEAIHYADRAHKGQKRKTADISYITHPLGVALILAIAGAGEDTITAGILHDVAEDTSRTIADIEKRFGKRIADLVSGLTEDDKGLPWDKRKKIALAHIPLMGRDALLVKSADAIYNMSEMTLALLISGRQIFKKFNAPQEKQLVKCKKTLAALKRAWLRNPLLPVLADRVRQLEQACKKRTDISALKTSRKRH